MKTIDMRFNIDMIRNFVGRCFNKYKCGAFQFTNSVTGAVGILLMITKEGRYGSEAEKVS